MKIAVLLVALLLPLVSGDPCQDAFDGCDWYFRSDDPDALPKIETFFLNASAPDVPFTPQIVSKNAVARIGIVNMNKAVPEFIFETDEILPITLFGTPPMTPTQFKPYALDRVMGSGVGFQTPQGNQFGMMVGRCVRVRFTQFQRKRGKDVRNVVVGKFSTKCVVFKTEPLPAPAA